MTPKEKAEELVESMYACAEINEYTAKRCALIAVDAIMEDLTVMNYGLQYLNRTAYWNEVKEEIDNIK